MKLGREFTGVISSKKPLKELFEIVLKVVGDTSKIIIKEKNIDNNGFSMSGSEKINWLSTNWPTSLEVSTDIIEEKKIIKVKVYSKGTSITQSSNSRKTLDNLLDNLKVYIDE
jgi:cell division FtsZ-interacting protein ZapD